MCVYLVFRQTHVILYVQYICLWTILILKPEWQDSDTIAISTNIANSDATKPICIKSLRGTSTEFRSDGIILHDTMH